MQWAISVEYRVSGLFSIYMNIITSTVCHTAFVFSESRCTSAMSAHHLRTVTAASVTKLVSLRCHYCNRSGKFWPTRNVWKCCGLTWQY